MTSAAAVSMAVYKFKLLFNSMTSVDTHPQTLIEGYFETHTSTIIQCRLVEVKLNQPPEIQPIVSHLHCSQSSYRLNKVLRRWKGRFRTNWEWRRLVQCPHQRYRYNISTHTPPLPPTLRPRGLKQKTGALSPLSHTKWVPMSCHSNRRN